MEISRPAFTALIRAVTTVAGGMHAAQAHGDQGE
jgi:hypothetical protein